MIQILWEYTVKPERRIEFETNYACGGAWAALFGKSAAYRGTVLLRDAEARDRYLTIDMWTDRSAYDAFRREHAPAYAELDRQCAEFTREERCLGIMDVV